MKKRKNEENSNSSSTAKSPKKLKVNTSPSRSNPTSIESSQTPDTKPAPATPESLNSIFDTPTSSEIDYFEASNSPQAAILNNFNSINNASSNHAALYPNLDDITIPSNTNQESICKKILNKIKSWYR